MILIVPTVLRIAMSMMNGESFEIGIGWSSSTDWTANHLSYWQFTLSLSKPSTSVYDRLCMDVNDELLEEEAMVNMLVGNLAPHLPRSPNRVWDPQGWVKRFIYERYSVCGKALEGHEGLPSPPAGPS